MKRQAFTHSDRRTIVSMADAGVPYCDIACLYETTRNAISGIVFRERHGWKPKTRKPVSRKLLEAFHMFRPVEPAKYPFAPDNTCPDFANDDEHIDSVTRERPHGFPVALAKRRRA